jgi:hypothetical protein
MPDIKNELPLAQLKKPEVAAKYEIADPEQLDQHIRVPNKYAGPLSGITLEAADQYVEKEKGTILRKKEATTAAAGPGPLAVVRNITAPAGEKEK